MRTITKERAQQIFLGNGPEPTASEERELARIALASLEAEAVAEVCEGFALRYIGYGPAPKSVVHTGDRLYTAPPAPVSMKDHHVRDLVNELRDIAVEYHGTQQLRERIARTVRAAMHQGAEPVSNRDELTDGWVACSERLPENKPGSYEYFVFEGLNNRVQHDYWNVPDAGDDCQFTPFWNHYGRYVTHWMPLPSAPQQEKNNEK